MESLSILNSLTRGPPRRTVRRHARGWTRSRRIGPALANCGASVRVDSLVRVTDPNGFAWTPTRDIVERANVTRLMRTHGIDDWRDLILRSQEDITWFWDAA